VYCFSRKECEQVRRLTCGCFCFNYLLTCKLISSDKVSVTVTSPFRFNVCFAFSHSFALSARSYIWTRLFWGIIYHYIWILHNEILFWMYKQSKSFSDNFWTFRRCKCYSLHLCKKNCVFTSQVHHNTRIGKPLLFVISPKHYLFPVLSPHEYFATLILDRSKALAP
jgi:hypothetical protein